MKKSVKVYIRTVRYSSLVVICLLIAFFGMAKAYENIRRIGFGEYRSAIEIEEESIKIFDFSIKL